MPDQVQFWNAWNAQAREQSVGEVSKDQARVVCQWLQGLGRSDLDIVEVGCGAGWLSGQLCRFGKVTGIDLADEVLQRAARRLSAVTFVAGDFMTLPLEHARYDVVVTLEVLSHVADQPAFLRKIATVLRAGGWLMLATQNRWSLRRNDVPPPMPGQIRQWVDRDELEKLLRDSGFESRSMFSITPQFNRGWLRYLNSNRLHRGLERVRLSAVGPFLRRVQEKTWMGWTIMALARRP